MAFLVFELIFNFIELICMYKFCNMFTISKVKIKKCISVSTCLALIVLLFNSISLISPFLSLMMIVLFYFGQLIVRKKEPLKLFILTVLYIAFIFAIDYISGLTISFVTKLSIDELTKEFSFERLPAALTSKVILIVLVNALNKHSLKNNHNKKANLFLSLATLFITVISAILYYTQLIDSDNDTNHLILLFFILMIIMILSIYFTFVNIIKNEEEKSNYLLIEQQYAMLGKYISEQEEIFLAWKESLHNHKHKLIAINQMLSGKKYSEAEKYIQDELNLFKDKAFYVYTGNNTVDVLLSNKMNLAQKCGISFTTNIASIESLKLTDIQLSVVLGNLIDNAFEAVVNESDKRVYLQISIVESLLVIKVTNTYSQDTLSLKTKKNTTFHGIGIKSIEKIVSEYDGKFSITQKNDTVIAIVII